MTRQQAKELLQRYRNGECTFAEQQAIKSWIEQEISIGRWELSEEERAQFGRDLKSRIDVARQPQKKVPVFGFRKLLAIASCFLLICTLFFLTDRYLGQKTGQSNLTSHIRPGRNSATLTLANGKQIALSDQMNGELAQESGVKISKSAEGQIIYHITDQEPESKDRTTRYNTLSTAFGQQYQIVLPDGTKVWLNNGSALTYPLSFSSIGKRSVELSGEAYFEVAKDHIHPFTVKTAGQEIQVLGTHFNVSAYGNEASVKTTLLEGRVRVHTSKEDLVLSPGQQAVNTGTLTVRNVDTELAVAWKNNQFMFESESIEDIMRMVERWYNVRVEYQDKIPEDRFSGAVSRFDNISEVLRILELTGKVHFKIEGRRIMVIK